MPHPLDQPFREKTMIGENINQYKVLEEIGSGGMGVVYRALDTKLDRTVALKFLPPRLGLDKGEKARFIHEAKAVAALDQQNICSIFEINETPEGRMFMAMGFYEGQTLKDKIASGPLPLAEALDIASQIATGLDTAHKKGIIHRDIKSANIIITPEGVVKILDFGLAKLKGVTKLTTEGTTMGTVAYMSPEQATGEEVDQRGDIWSLGVVLYEMLTGQLPFKGEYEQSVMYAILHEEPQPVNACRSGIPPELEHMVEKTLSKKPRQRYQHIDELLVDLDCLREKTKGKISPSPIHRKFTARRALVLAGIFLAMTEKGRGKRGNTT